MNELNPMRSNITVVAWSIRRMATGSQLRSAVMRAKLLDSCSPFIPDEDLGRHS